MCDCEGLRDDRRAISNFEKKKKRIIIKTRLESSKGIHCAMKPIRIQLKCPYNSSNKKIPMYEFLRFYIHCKSNVLFCISAHVREAASTNVLLVLYNSA